jgi:hypothetical protein
LAQSGDQRALHTLVIGSAKLAWRCCQRRLSDFEDVGIEPLEVLHIALYGPGGNAKSGMARAAMKFDPHVARWSTYSKYWVDEALGGALEKARNSAYVSSQLPGSYTPDFEESDLHAAASVVEEILITLPPRTQVVLRAALSHRDIQRPETAKRLGVSKERVRQIEVAGFELLRKRLEAAGYSAESLGLV